MASNFPIIIRKRRSEWSIYMSWLWQSQDTKNISSISITRSATRHHGRGIIDVHGSTFSNLNSINKQLSFIVKIPRLQLFKIDHVISVYLSLVGKIVRLLKLTFVSWFNHGRVFNNFKPLNIWIKMTFIELLL